MAMVTETEMVQEQATLDLATAMDVGTDAVREEKLAMAMAMVTDHQGIC